MSSDYTYDGRIDITQDALADAITELVGDPPPAPVRVGQLAAALRDCASVEVTDWTETSAAAGSPTITLNLYGASRSPELLKNALHDLSPYASARVECSAPGEGDWLYITERDGVHEYGGILAFPGAPSVGVLAPRKK